MVLIKGPPSTFFRNNNLPPSTAYSVVSHIWGENVTIRSFPYLPSLPSPIRLNNNSAKASWLASLHARSDEYIWIDVCSINQDSTDDKSHQVSIMDMIYHDAECCYIYVEDPDWMHLLEDIMSLAEGLEDSFEKLLIDLDRLSSSGTYHSRMWTLQEYVLTRRKVYTFMKDDGTTITVSSTTLKTPLNSLLSNPKTRSKTRSTITSIFGIASLSDFDSALESPSPQLPPPPSVTSPTSITRILATSSSPQISSKDRHLTTWLTYFHGPRATPRASSRLKDQIFGCYKLVGVELTTRYDGSTFDIVNEWIRHLQDASFIVSIDLLGGFEVDFIKVAVETARESDRIVGELGGYPESLVVGNRRHERLVKCQEVGGEALWKVYAAGCPAVEGGDGQVLDRAVPAALSFLVNYGSGGGNVELDEEGDEGTSVTSAPPPPPPPSWIDGPRPPQPSPGMSVPVPPPPPPSMSYPAPPPPPLHHVSGPLPPPPPLPSISYPLPLEVPPPPPPRPSMSISPSPSRLSKFKVSSPPPPPPDYEEPSHTDSEVPMPPAVTINVEAIDAPSVAIDPPTVDTPTVIGQETPTSGQAPHIPIIKPLRPSKPITMPMPVAIDPPTVDAPTVIGQETSTSGQAPHIPIIKPLRPSKPITMPVPVQPTAPITLPAPVSQVVDAAQAEDLPPVPITIVADVAESETPVNGDADAAPGSMNDKYYKLSKPGEEHSYSIPYESTPKAKRKKKEDKMDTTSQSDLITGSIQESYSEWGVEIVGGGGGKVEELEMGSVEGGDAKIQGHRRRRWWKSGKHVAIGIVVFLAVIVAVVLGVMFGLR
ncbi:hypothetical protein HK097_000247 [Rhizophlyctis rosea]|uniref:Heterokaryon incompatibility domain-containing protein n=1 Tax=Rhizophlyctis rosea TaxID=64517 RepID=A0AAD5SI59_9FUNG|nr:hypothetical protein HK097_000247 [Rhizophlyctis rosea]